jgi:hypothetical protein
MVRLPTQSLDAIPARAEPRDTRRPVLPPAFANIGKCRSNGVSSDMQRFQSIGGIKALPYPAYPPSRDSPTQHPRNNYSKNNGNNKTQAM